MRRVSRLKVLLAERGQTQKELAAAVGTTPGVISLLANGRAEPWPKIRRTLAEYLGEDPFDTDTADALVAQRAAQGLGPTVTDPDALRVVAGLAHRTVVEAK